MPKYNPQFQWIDDEQYPLSDWLMPDSIYNSREVRVYKKFEQSSAQLIIVKVSWLTQSDILCKTKFRQIPYKEEKGWFAIFAG